MTNNQSKLNNQTNTTYEYKILEDCIPNGKDFQNWLIRFHLKIHPQLIKKSLNKYL